MITSWLAVLALALSGNFLWGLLLTAVLLCIESGWLNPRVR